MTLVELKKGYLGIVLPDQARSTLLALFPPTYARSVAHHVTIEFLPKKLTQEVVEAWVTKDHVVEVYGVARDNGVEAVLVSIDGEKVRADGHRYHITLSLDPDRKPAESKALTDNDSLIKPVEPLTLTRASATIIPY